MEERTRNLKHSIPCINFRRKDMPVSIYPSGREYWFFLVYELAFDKSNRFLAEEGYVTVDFPGKKKCIFRI